MCGTIYVKGRYYYYENQCLLEWISISHIINTINNAKIDNQELEQASNCICKYVSHVTHTTTNGRFDDDDMR